MSRAVLIIALARVLNRQPTPEEYNAHRLALLECCPQGRLYVPRSAMDAEEVRLAIVGLRAEGKTYREIAAMLEVSQKTIAGVLSNWAAKCSV